MLQDDANDRIALCALGYCLLEQHKGLEAERIFVRVLEKDRRFLIARHGRALACLIQKKQVRRALDLFQDTVSLDSKFTRRRITIWRCATWQCAAWIWTHHFSNVVKRFPAALSDAYFKLGIFYESLYLF